jgi:ATP-dependent DNA helicase RecG
LAQNSSLSLEEIIMLDKVQKRKRINDDEERHLRSKNLIEGRKPNFFISLKVAQKTFLKADYTKTKGLDNIYYQDLVIKALQQHNNLNRQDIDLLLFSKLPDWMNDKQKKTKITNIIAKLRSTNVIENTGTDVRPNWILK